jgi:UTP--glucose-1-phosphate uridylyltransferase
MKAVITAANPLHRNLPVQTLSDPTGQPVPLLSLHLRDLEAAGIEAVGLIHHPEDAELYRSAAGAYAQRLTLIPQDAPRGFGDAVLRARDFAGDGPFLLLVCDHIYLSRDPGTNCFEQLLKLHADLKHSISAVQSTHESQVTRFGVVAGEPVGGKKGVYRIREVREKPTPTEAELHLRVPGHRAGYYLGFFGIHVLEPEIFPLLEEQTREQGTLGLSPALDALARRGRLLAGLLEGSRFDLEGEYGLLQAQLAMALSGPNREMVLADLVRVLADTSASGSEVKRLS